MGTPDVTLEALKVGMAAALPGRIVTRSFKPLAVRSSDELEAGIVTLISRGEQGYTNSYGNEARDGTISTVLVGQLKVADDADPLAVEQAELALAEEIKAFLQVPLPDGVAECLATGFAQSGQIEAPYGWVAFELEVRGG